MKTTEQINAEFDEMYKNPISNMWTEEFTNKIKSFIHTTRENDLKDAFIKGYKAGNNIQIDWERITQTQRDDFLSTLTNNIT